MVKGKVCCAPSEIENANIKQGHQVAPAELKAHLLVHPFVSNWVVIQTPDARSGEVPKAFVVETAQHISESNEEVGQALKKFVADHKASCKHLKGDVEIVNDILKSANGKILRRVLRDREK